MTATANRSFVNRKARIGRGGGVPLVALVTSLALVNGASAGPAPASIEEKARETWNVVRIADNDVGFLRATVEPAPVDGTAGWRTTSEMSLVINRLGHAVPISSKSRVTETEAGLLREVDFEMSMSAMATSSHAVVESESILVKSRTGDRSYEHRVPYTGELLGPEGIRRATCERLRAVGDEVSLQTFVAELGIVAIQKRTQTPLDSSPAAVALSVAKSVREEVMGVAPRALWLDRLGDTVRHRESGPFGELVIERSERERALKAAAGAELPAEMFDRTVARANVRLPQARAIESMTLRLTHEEPALGWPDLESLDQRVVSRETGAVTLEIRRVSPPGVGIARPVAATDANRQYLEPNATSNSDAPEVRRIAEVGAGNERDAYRAALSLRDWVSERLTFDLGVALAPASEVIRDRKGTCAAYASVLTALCRAAGIPARYVMGFVYLRGAWGGHAWIEVGLGDQWIPLDAAIPGPSPADAARFRFVTSSLSGGIGVLSAGGQKLYGHVKVDVLSYSLEGRKIDVADDAPLFAVEGNRYTNVGLGIALTKPEGFEFEKLQAVWPERALVSATGPSGRAFRLMEDAIPPRTSADTAARSALDEIVPGGERTEIVVAGRRSHRACSPRKSALAVPDGLGLWVLVAEGNDAPALLERVAASLSLGAARER